MTLFQGPSLADTIKRINAWLPKRHFPLLLGRGVPIGVVSLDGGIWSLHKLIIDPNTPVQFREWPWLKVGDLVVSASSKESLIDTLKWWWDKYLDSVPSPTYLTMIGYDPNEKWLEFTAMIPPRQHLALADLSVVLGFLHNGTAKGQKVESVRITFHSRAAARRELPWLIRLGITAQFLADDGTWQVLGKEALAEPAIDDEFVYSEEFAEMLESVISGDFEAVEGWRDTFTAEMSPQAVNGYYELENWVQKAALIQLIQDRGNSDCHRILIDFLGAPANDDDDTIWLSKAVALWKLNQADFSQLLDLGPHDVEVRSRAFLATLAD